MSGDIQVTILLPNPTSATVKDAHTMIQAAKKAGRIVGVDFHKREDPRIKEAEARFQKGRYGTFQAGVFYMIDKLLVADPNHSPRFFASPDFAERNSPVSFLTVHMADALMKIVRLIQTQVRATGYVHKLPSLKLLAVKGCDLMDTEIQFTTGAVAHVITGGTLPDTAWATTVQSGWLICSDGLLDLGLDSPGLREIHSEGVAEVNPLFRNFETDGSVTGYGISSPGKFYQQILAWRNGVLPVEQREAANNPLTLGFYTTLVLEAAEQSLAEGKRLETGATLGTPVNLRELAATSIGEAAAGEYQLQ